MQLKLNIVAVLLIASAQSQDTSGTGAPTCNPQPIINYNFGSSEIPPPFTDGNNRPSVAHGRPGRIGPPGGFGPKGQKGERGQPDDTRRNLMQQQTRLEELERENSELRRQVQVQDLKTNMTRVFLLRGYMELDDGWIAPFNGYQYKANLNPSSWDESRRVCQQWGGDLVVYGVQDVTKKISRALRLPGGIYYWVGLNDKASEGTYLWVNGDQASSNNDELWWPTYPKNSDANDCMASYLLIREYGFRVWDAPCASHYRSLCEKQV